MPRVGSQQGRRRDGYANLKTASVSLILRLPGCLQTAVQTHLANCKHWSSEVAEFEVRYKQWGFQEFVFRFAIALLFLFSRSCRSCQDLLAPVECASPKAALLIFSRTDAFSSTSAVSSLSSSTRTRSCHDNIKIKTDKPRKTEKWPAGGRYTAASPLAPSRSSLVGTAHSSPRTALQPSSRRPMLYLRPSMRRMAARLSNRCMAHRRNSPDMARRRRSSQATELHHSSDRRMVAHRSSTPMASRALSHMVRRLRSRRTALLINNLHPGNNLLRELRAQDINHQRHNRRMLRLFTVHLRHGASHLLHLQLLHIRRSNLRLAGISMASTSRRMVLPRSPLTLRSSQPTGRLPRSPRLLNPPKACQCTASSLLKLTDNKRQPNTHKLRLWGHHLHNLLSNRRSSITPISTPGRATSMAHQVPRLPHHTEPPACQVRLQGNSEGRRQVVEARSPNCPSLVPISEAWCKPRFTATWTI
jgi:hypothetical protein